MGQKHTTQEQNRLVSFSLILIAFCCSWLPLRTIDSNPDPIHTASSHPIPLSLPPNPRHPNPMQTDTLCPTRHRQTKDNTATHSPLRTWGLCPPLRSSIARKTHDREKASRERVEWNDSFTPLKCRTYREHTNMMPVRWGAGGDKPVAEESNGGNEERVRRSEPSQNR